MSLARSHHWLPFTQMGDFDASARTFVRGAGNYLYDARGRRIFDAVSSIWTTIHGHCRPEIVEAISRQAALLDHATSLGATNPAAEDLADRLCALTRTDYAFFASDGASAIEAALKIALQYWQNVGEPQRTRFVRMCDGYHGDTIGAMSVSDIAMFRERFSAVTFETYAYPDVAAACSRDDVAAVIVEPMVRAAAGMRLVPPQTYGALRDIAPLVIADEIATGFGRTGTMFAFEQTSLRPDIVCVGKGMTGGTLALSATLATSRIYDAFLSEPERARHFFHGHSYAGNPIACAAALASLEIFVKDGTLARVAELTSVAATRLARLNALPHVRETRQAGSMIGVELNPQCVRADAARSSAWRVSDGLYKRGHFTRPIGETVQFVPPLSSEPQEIDAFFDALEAELQT